MKYQGSPPPLGYPSNLFCSSLDLLFPMPCTYSGLSPASPHPLLPPYLSPNSFRLAFLVPPLSHFGSYAYTILCYLLVFSIVFFSSMYTFGLFFSTLWCLLSPLTPSIVLVTRKMYLFHHFLFLLAVYVSTAKRIL